VWNGLGILKKVAYDFSNWSFQLLKHGVPAKREKLFIDVVRFNEIFYFSFFIFHFPNDLFQKRDFLLGKIPFPGEVGHEGDEVLAGEHFEQFEIAAGDLFPVDGGLVDGGVLGGPADDSFVHQPVEPGMDGRLGKVSASRAEPLDRLAEVDRPLRPE